MQSTTAGKLGIVLILLGLTSVPFLASAADEPLTKSNRAAYHEKLDERIRGLDEKIAKNGKSPDLYSQRGDAHFFHAQFAEAVADYDKIVELDPATEPSQWRRGIAYFYAGRYKDAAHQFEIYHSFDNVDRENGIWRYLSQAKSLGIEKAREGLLKYKKDDREPFPDVYRLFAGELTGDEVLKRINDAKIGPEERSKRLFYAELYVGLNEFVEGRLDSAKQHLREAVKNEWGPTAGYGPNYMWHVGRVHYDLLDAPKPQDPKAPGAEEKEKE